MTATYEWHVMGVPEIHAIQAELEKRSAEGWDLVESYFENGATFGSRGRHVLIFRRLKVSVVA